ncbi:hypothetical protein [Paenibacillus qinlingensis]|uniref:hypothetical protein n=1 Tax=Paenibacillus qinlingensis TaxID=1837343 RepID=UPI001567A462|nr:hypothetical protein [Paenibacillus qinlingensis]NQX61820.1 hypothetical protein [Paenibacillus qinlingensis]
MPKRKAEVASIMLCDGGQYYPGTKTKLACVITSDERALFYRVGDDCTEARAKVLLSTLVNDSKTKPMKREDFL